MSLYRYVVVVSIGCIITHVGSEIAVDVGIAEVWGEAQTQHKSSENTQPALPRTRHTFTKQLEHFVTNSLSLIVNYDK